MVKLALIAAALAGCYSATPAIGVPCAADQTCPQGQFCDLARNPPLCVTMALDAALDSAVACSPTNPATCPVDAPVCDAASMTCRRCAADAECGSNACHESLGTCVDAALALWVDPAGDDGNACTQTEPCATIGHAIDHADNTRSFVRIAPGDYRETLTINRSIVLSGPMRTGGAKLVGPAFGPAVTANGQVAVVTAETLQVSATSGAAFDVNNSATLAVFGVAIDGGNVGVSAQSSTVEIRQSTIANANRGIEALNNSTLLVLRSHVTGSKDQAMRVSGSKYTITSSLFVSNNRGISIEGPNAPGGVLSHNTIVGTTNDFAVRCGSPGVIVANTIFATNKVPSVDANRCTVRYSLASDTLFAGTGNLLDDPGFVTSTDYHLGPTSKAIDAADPQSTEAVDFDGQQRPRGPRRDIGAFER